MTRRLRLTAVGLVAAAAACTDIATPIRNDLYEWRLIVPRVAGTGLDSLSFRWPRNRQPVRIWAEDAVGLSDNVPRAIAAWRAAFLYGELDATMVSDSTSADVIVRAGSAPGIDFSRIRLHSALAPECAGATDLDVSEDHTQLRLPVRVYLDPRVDAADPALPDCLALTTTHELGHAFGIWRHSSDAADLMYTNPVVPGPGERDLGTLEVIYHRPANVEPVGP